MNRLSVRLFTIIALPLLITACADDAPRVDEQGKSIEGTAEVDVPISSPTFGVINLFRAAGNSVKVTGKISRGSLKDGFAMKINEVDNLEVFEFSSADDRAEADRTISPDGRTIGGATIDWGGDPHLYQTEKLIIVYIGDDKGNMEALEGSFGKEFAGKK